LLSLFKLLFDHRGLNNAQTFNLRLITLAILFTTFSGAIRKWGVSSGFVGNTFLLVQLLMPIGLFFLLKKNTIKPGSKALLFLYGITLAILAFNPLNQTLYHGVFGIILHGGFWISLFVYLDNSALFPLERLLPLLAVLLLFETGLGLLQYRLPAGHILNKYAFEGSAGSIARVGDAIRVTGTFSYLSGYTAFLMAAGLAVPAIFKLGYSKKFKYPVVLGLLTASMLSGARAAFVVSLFFIVFAVYIDLKRYNPVRGALNVLLFGMVLGSFASQISFVQQAFDNILIRFQSGASTREYNSRTLGVFEEVIHFRGEYPITGLGLGATYQGANAIWGASRYVKLYPGGYEEEPERIVLEGGYLLLFFKLLLLFFLLLKSKIPKGFLLLLFLFQFIGFPIVFNIYNAFYFFVGLAILDRAYRRY